METPNMSSDATLSKTADRVAVRIPCVGCGYDLRGLAPAGNCPECGTAIQRSLDGKLLRFAEVRWTRRLALGATLLFWGILASALMINWGFRTPRYELVFNVGRWLVPASVVLTGWWLVTRPAPERQVAEPAMSLRRGVWGLACFGFAVGGWEAVFESQHTADPLPELSSLATTMHLLLAIVLIGNFARGLTPRLARPDLARQTWIVQVLLVIGAAGMGVLSLAAWLFTRSFPTALPTNSDGWYVHGFGDVLIPLPLAHVAAPLMLILLGALIWALVLYRRYAVALWHEARLAGERKGDTLLRPTSTGADTHD